eukprot:scaffold4067_cov267-Pinguiococcus_pyrenoidosus.AAC.4
MILKLQGADGVRDFLQRVADAVGVVIHWIDLPGIPCHRMTRVPNAINCRVPHVQVGTLHVNLRAQDRAALGHVAGLHCPKNLKTLLPRTHPIRRVLSWLRQGSPVLAHLFRAQRVDVRQVLLDEELGAFVKHVEVVTAVAHFAVPGRLAAAQPLHVLEDCVDVLDVLLQRVGVVKAHVRRPWKGEPSENATDVISCEVGPLLLPKHMPLSAITSQITVAPSTLVPLGV